MPTEGTGECLLGGGRVPGVTGVSEDGCRGLADLLGQLGGGGDGLLGLPVVAEVEVGEGLLVMEKLALMSN